MGFNQILVTLGHTSSKFSDIVAPFAGGKLNPERSLGGTVNFFVHSGFLAFLRHRIGFPNIFSLAAIFIGFDLLACLFIAALTAEMAFAISSSGTASIGTGAIWRQANQ